MRRFGDAGSWRLGSGTRRPFTTAILDLSDPMAQGVNQIAAICSSMSAP
jgi:hypothetical protein